MKIFQGLPTIGNYIAQYDFRMIYDLGPNLLSSTSHQAEINHGNEGL